LAGLVIAGFGAYFAGEYQGTERSMQDFHLISFHGQGPFATLVFDFGEGTPTCVGILNITGVWEELSCD